MEQAGRTRRWLAATVAVGLLAATVTGCNDDGRLLVPADEEPAAASALTRAGTQEGLAPTSE